MLLNYLTIAIRNLYKYKIYSFINILGLSVGIAFFTLLLILIRHELSFDSIHKNNQRIFRVTKLIEKNGVGEKAASVPFPMGPTMKEFYPEYVENTVRMFNFQVPSHSIEYKEIRDNEPFLYFADESFFEIFDFPLALGDPKIAINRPFSVVISDRAASKYFKGENPIGKKLIYEDKTTLTITGVFAPKTYASHFEFDFIVAFSSLYQMDIDPEIIKSNWKWDPCWTYVLLQEGKSPEDLEYLLDKLVLKVFPESFREEVNIFLQPVREIHLYSDLDFELSPNGDIRYIYLFAAIALLILIIAAINFTNLSSAKSSLRAKEIGIRKAIGADRMELGKQFFIEFIFICLIAILIAFVLVELLLPFLSNVADTDLDFTHLDKSLLLTSIISSGLLIGMLSSLFPAYYLAKFRPAEVLSGSIVLGVRSRRFRGVLVILQFVITGFLLITTFVSIGQFAYLKNADLGFNKEQILIIPIANTNLRFNFDSLKKDLLKSEVIVSVTAMEEVLGTNYRIHDYLPKSKEKQNEYIYLPSLMVDYDFTETFDISLVAGRTFKRGENDEYKGILVNEKMVKYLGYKSNKGILGQKLKSRGGAERIIGVVKDFNFQSLHSEITPFVIDMPSARSKFFYSKFIAIKVKENHEYQALLASKKIWYKFLPNRTFEYYFLSKKLNKMYFKERKLGLVTGYFSIVAIIIACLGLFGLSSFVVDMRKKEIAIRKAIGTTDVSIVFLLLKEFFLLVGVAILISWPISYFVMENWLKSFPFRVNMGLGVYLDAALIIFTITLITVS
nr:ABC transporter permease [Flammeovirgaceae bacterium]